MPDVFSIDTSGGGNVYGGAVVFAVHGSLGTLTAVARLDFEAPEPVWLVLVAEDSGSVSMPTLSVSRNVSITIVSRIFFNSLGREGGGEMGCSRAPVPRF